MSSFAFDVSLMSAIVDLGRGGGGGGGGKHLRGCCECPGNMHGGYRQESSALVGCRKKVFENARHMWFLVAAHLSSCHGGCGHDDASHAHPQANCNCYSTYPMRACAVGVCPS